ncbi:hypothetical protein HanRHA438_Chr17g0801631 [Helianthus annuus]|uniref:Uncharacterized protein n=1 Tax=Helianthus annuus TaxID=4232 RepID=A0A9K3GU39_HELAN|nr:hypothetical protein HanXRQr2_Chr17g0791311 [Helianthus annuus]KAJ0812196.1 hypothetical protein HanPSC8_Chr17g0759211 [Helianthus annuus]KAJ0825298.1 hypothetical protein HanRHA438_Chr17g0801631 [Helianthus annuus]
MRISDPQFEFPLLSQKPSSRRCFSHDISSSPFKIIKCSTSFTITSDVSQSIASHYCIKGSIRVSQHKP